MLQISKINSFKSITVYFIHYGFLNKQFLLKFKNNSPLSFLRFYKRRYQPLVCVRSPKHFNVGKYKFLHIKTSYQLFYKLNLKSYYTKSLNTISYEIFKDSIPTLPNSLKTHIKLKTIDKVSFKIL